MSQAPGPAPSPPHPHAWESDTVRPGPPGKGLTSWLSSLRAQGLVIGGAADRVLVVAVALGVLLATAVLAAAPTFTDAIADLGLQRALASRPATLQATQVDASLYAIDSQTLGGLDRQIRSTVARTAGWFLREPFVNGSSARGQVSTTLGKTPDSGSPAGVLQFFRGYESRVRVVSGSLPGASTGDGALHVALGEQAAAVLGLKPGERVTFFAPHGGQADLVIDGLLAQADPSDLAWQGSTVWFRAGAEGNSPPTLRFFVAEDAFFSAVPALLPGLSGTYTWYFPGNTSALDSRNMGEAAAALDSLRAEVPTAVARTNVFSALDGTIADVRERRLFTGLPVLAILLQVSALVLFLVWLLGAAMAERQSRPIAVLRSRGASAGQVLVAEAAVGLAIVIPAAMLGPIVALLAVRLTGYLPAFSEATAGGALPARLGVRAFAGAGVGSVLSLLFLALPAFFAARRTVVEDERVHGRPGSKPALYRYYVDVLVLGAGLLLYWELDQGQGAVSRSIFGDRNVDPVLLFAPGLLVAGAGLVMLRLLPPAVGAIRRTLSAVLGASSTLVLNRMARAPSGYVRVAVLVMVVAALTALSATFGSTVQESQDARAQYAAGADLRLQGVTGNSAPDGSDLLAAGEAGAPGARVLPVERLRLNVGQAGQAVPATILGIDSDAARQTVATRNDYFTGSPDQFYEAVRGNRSLDPGLKLPGEPEFVGVFVQAEPVEPNSNVWLRLSDESGRYFSVLLGPLAQPGWRFYEADLARAIPGFPAGVSFPLRVQAIFFSNLGQSTTDAQGSLYIDSLQVRQDATHAPELVEDFEGTAQYRAPPITALSRDVLQTTASRFHDGMHSAQFEWFASPSTAPRYVVLRNYNAPLPAAVSTELLSRLGLRPGDDFVINLGLDVLPITVVTSFNYYPTLMPGDGGIVVELRNLTAAAQLLDVPAKATPNELWLNGEGINRDAVLDSLKDARIRALRLDALADFRDEVAGDPLLAAAGSGLFTLGLGAAVVVAVLGLGVSLDEIVRRRRLEAAVVRSLGLTAGQVARSWWLEVTAMIVFGTAVGLVLGRVLGGTMLSFLAFDERGLPVVPPYSVVTDWRVVGVVAGLLGGAAVLAGVIFAASLRRLRPAAELRLVD